MKRRNVACLKCFKDKRLLKWISETGTRSNCSWCGSRNTLVVSMEELGPLFREVAGIYEPVAWDRGDNISFLLQEDWDIFSDRIENAPNNLMDTMAITILEAGLNPKDDLDEPDYRGSFTRSSEWLEDNWHEKIDKIMETAKTELTIHTNQSRFDPSFTPEAHEVAFEDFGIDYKEGEILYRARIHEDRNRKERFALHELGAPPPERARPGRANRPGEPVLYLSSDEQTALSEVRAWKGAPVAIAKVRLKKRLWIVNLKNHRPLESPFFEEMLDWKLQLAGLFHRFGEELSRPVMPHEQDVLYRPSQHLCDLVKQNGFDGLAYPSAMGPGFNLVIFDPETVEILDSKYIRVRDVQYDYEILKESHPLYDETPYDHLLQKDLK